MLVSGMVDVFLGMFIVEGLFSWMVWVRADLSWVMFLGWGVFVCVMFLLLVRLFVGDGFLLLMFFV